MPFFGELYCWHTDFQFIDIAFLSGSWGAKRAGTFSSQDVEAFKFNFASRGIGRRMTSCVTSCVNSVQSSSLVEGEEQDNYTSSSFAQNLSDENQFSFKCYEHTYIPNCKVA